MTTSKRSGLGAWGAAAFFSFAAMAGLSACGDDEASQSQASDAGSRGSPSEQSPVDDDKADDPNDSDSDDEIETDVSQGTSPTGCLVGTWLADNERLGALFKSAATGTDAAGSVSDPTGTVLVTFGPEGQYTVNYQAWTLTLAQQGMTIDLVREGTDVGSYDAGDDGTVEWTEITMGSVASMTTPAGTHQVASEPSSTSATFTCENDTLEVTADGSTSALHRQ